MNELDDLLQRATDRIPAPALGSRALAAARVRRRNRRAGAVTSIAVALVVAGIATVGWIDRTTGEPQPAPPVGTVTPTPAPGPTTWDLRDTADLPGADPATAPLLPDQLDVPDLAPHVEDDPVDAAVLAVDDGADVLLLGSDGEWRCVVVTGRTQQAPELSPRGTRLVVATTDGFVTVDLSTGVQSRLPFPPPSGGDAVLGVPDFQGPVGWTVRPIAQLDDGTGLLEVARGPRGRGEWWVVRWDPATDDLTLVSTVRANAPKPTSYAYQLLTR